MTERQSPFACDMNAIAPEMRSAHLATIQRLFQSAEDMRELPNGYTFRLRDEPGALQRAAEFISLERLCCPFFSFSLEVESEVGAVWLTVSGREGVKPFIMAEIGEHLHGVTRD